MKKNVKAIFAGLAAAALLAGFSSCSNGSSDDSLNKPAGSSTGANQTDTNNDEVFSGDEISFVANVASYDSKDSVLIIKYDRTAEGSDDAISLTNVKLNVTVNGETIETPSTINFELDPYSSFDKSYNYASEETAAKQHDYKYKFNLGKKINVNDVVKVQLVSAKVTGAGASRVKLGSLTVSLIDVSQYATVKAYYTELCAENYKCLITKKNGADLNATVAVEEPANPTPANNTPENPAPANPTPENPTPATPENPATDTNNTTPAATTLTKTSILSGIQAGTDVWGSGTNTTANDNGTYNVVADIDRSAIPDNDPQKKWGGNIAAVPVCFGAGDLTGFTHIVLEADLTTFTINDSQEYAGIELKVANDNDSKTKVIRATELFNNGKAEISLSEVDFLAEATKVMFSFRGTGSLTVKDISKAK